MKIENFTKQKIAFIHNVDNSYFRQMIINRGFNVFFAYKPQNFFLRQIRKFHLKSKLSYTNIWFNKSLEKLQSYNTIILFDATLSYDFLMFIRNKFPKKRLIFWYWNPVRKSLNPDLLDDGFYEKWTYSLRDAKIYNLNYNTTFYFSDIETRNKINNYDIFFIGRDKGRYNKLKKLENKFIELNLNCNFHIVPNKKLFLNKKKSYKKPISYLKVLDYIAESRAILDVLDNPNDGLTIRTMESIFLNKKLITNNKNIIKYDFYNEDNIFILGQDDLNKLPYFLNLEYKEIDPEIIEKYDFESWIERFI